MYKLRLPLLVLTFSMTIFFLSCSKENNSSCAERHTKYLDKTNAAAQKYGSNPTVANCNAYKTAIQEYINKTKGCPGAQTKSLTELLNSIDCK